MFRYQLAVTFQSLLFQSKLLQHYLTFFLNSRKKFSLECIKESDLGEGTPGRKHEFSFSLLRPKACLPFTAAPDGGLLGFSFMTYRVIGRSPANSQIKKSKEIRVAMSSSCLMNSHSTFSKSDIPAFVWKLLSDHLYSRPLLV